MRNAKFRPDAGCGVGMRDAGKSDAGCGNEQCGVRGRLLRGIRIPHRTVPYTAFQPRIPHRAESRLSLPIPHSGSRMNLRTSLGYGMSKLIAISATADTTRIRLSLNYARSLEGVGPGPIGRAAAHRPYARRGDPGFHRGTPADRRRGRRSGALRSSASSEPRRDQPTARCHRARADRGRAHATAPAARRYAAEYRS